MPASWKQLSFVPSEEALNALREHWSWLVDPAMEAFMAAASGDVFFQAPDASIHWLNTSAGEFTQIALDRNEFLIRMREDGGTEWLMAPLIDALLDEGQVLGADQCFAFKVLPVLGGTYTPDNMTPMSAAGWYGFSGYLHQQIKDLPDGTRIQLRVDET